MKWQAYWKAILSFGSTVVLPGVVMWIQTGQPWPTSASGWALWAVTVFGTTGAVAGGPANKTAGKHEVA
jgi:hypothetical protein